MCGIVGAYSFNNNNFKITKPYIIKMRDTMIHRGPDGAGTWVSNDGRVGLGHRRLSIIDLSDAATQPMCNEDATLWVSFNGEIYNHAEIHQELEKLSGHQWKTDHSDTEVILHAFEQWGIDCVHKFRGMFAIALWAVNVETDSIIIEVNGVSKTYPRYEMQKLMENRTVDNNNINFIPSVPINNDLLSYLFSKIQIARKKDLLNKSLAENFDENIVEFDFILGEPK
jgi:hypothetical protein